MDIVFIIERHHVTDLFIDCPQNALDLGDEGHFREDVRTAATFISLNSPFTFRVAPDHAFPASRHDVLDLWKMWPQQAQLPE